MSDKIYEACQYLKCTTTMTTHDMDNVEHVKNPQVFDGGFVPLKDAYEYSCARGKSIDEALQNLKKVVEGREEKALSSFEVVCKAQGKPTLTEVRGLFERVGDYFTRPSLKLCQDFKVSRNVQVPYDAVHEVVVYRAEVVTKDEKICASGAKLGEAQAAHGRKVSSVCSEEGVVCEAKGNPKLSIEESIFERIGGFLASIGYFMGSGREPRQKQ